MSSSVVVLYFFSSFRSSFYKFVFSTFYSSFYRFSCSGGCYYLGCERLDGCYCSDESHYTYLIFME